MLEVRRQVPGKLVVAADHAVLRERGDQAEGQGLVHGGEDTGCRSREKAEARWAFPRPPGQIAMPSGAWRTGRFLPGACCLFSTPFVASYLLTNRSDNVFPNITESE
ncbi:hypothetical protein D9M73_276590 [compost metagenome]